jgi:hypothetical protein
MTTTSHTSVHAAHDQLTERMRAASTTIIAITLIVCALVGWYLIVHMALSRSGL